MTSWTICTQVSLVRSIHDPPKSNEGHHHSHQWTVCQILGYNRVRMHEPLVWHLSVWLKSMLKSLTTASISWSCKSIAPSSSSKASWNSRWPKKAVIKWQIYTQTRSRVWYLGNVRRRAQNLLKEIWHTDINVENDLQKIAQPPKGQMFQNPFQSSQTLQSLKLSSAAFVPEDKICDNPVVTPWEKWTMIGILMHYMTQC